MIPAPAFYAEGIGPPLRPTDEALAARMPSPLAALAGRWRIARGLALGLHARRGPGAVVIRRAPGTLVALWVAALPPARRTIFVCELIRRPPPASAWRRVLVRVFEALVEGPALRRAMAGGQVMSAAERAECVARHRLDPARVHHVAWPLCETGASEPAPIREGGRRVFSSGRAACDWETLFAAAAGSQWRLAVVSAGRELGRVRELAGEVGAEVHAELAFAEHDRLLRSSDVCALVLAERPGAAGHARLAAAVEAGIAVVTTDVSSLDGYLVAGETAAVVPVGDPAALRARIDELLADPDARRRLRDRARERARGWTYADYFGRLRELIAAALEPTG